MLLVAAGRLPSSGGERHCGPGLRAEHFARALSESGHRVLVFSCDVARGEKSERIDGPAAVAPGIDLIEASEAAFASEALRRAARAFQPDATVAATVYGASLALRLGLEVPLWADVFGDFMAEAQAKALATGDDSALVRFWQMFIPVLERADMFSAVSDRQRWALLGQLGMAGRLSRPTAASRLVEVIPCSARAEQPRGPAAVARGRLVPEDAFVVLWTGTFNTWCDVETLVKGLERAMAADRRICLVATGGAVPGHDEITYVRFRRLVEGSPFRERFHLLGWLDRSRFVALVGEADVGIHIERDILERRLGGENRVAEWAVLGLPCVTTGLSEFGGHLVAQGLAFGVGPANPESLARRLCELARDPAQVQAAGRRLAAWAKCEIDYLATAQPLVRWCERPAFAPDRSAARPISAGLLSEPAALATLLERYLDALSLAEVSRRGGRWLLRRLRRKAAGAFEKQRGGQ